MREISSNRMIEIRRKANEINRDFTEEEIRYLVSILNRKELLEDIRKSVAGGSYMVATETCPYCGRPL